MNRLFVSALVAAGLVVAGCAKRPDAIAPAALPPTTYDALSCEELRRELSEERFKLTSLSASQNEAATSDAIGVFLVGVPISSVAGGDWEGLIAVSKGKVLAMEAELTERCGG